MACSNSVKVTNLSNSIELRGKQQRRGMPKWVTPFFRHPRVARSALLAWFRLTSGVSGARRMHPPLVPAGHLHPFPRYKACSFSKDYVPHTLLPPPQPNCRTSTVSIMRILCLHGVGSSGSILESQLDAFVKAADPSYEFVYADGPYPSEKGPGT